MRGMPRNNSRMAELTFQCFRLGRAVTSGNISRSKSPSRLLRVLSPVETRESRLPKTDMPGRFMMLLLVRRNVVSDSVLEAEAASSIDLF